MRDEFVGDIGDYGKYGLLRVLNRASAFRLGIVWMRTNTVATPSSRKPFDYLARPVNGDGLLSACDPELYGILKSLVGAGRQTIANLEASHALPAGTTYFGDLLDFGGMPAVGKKAADDRLLFRKEWFRSALNALQATELIFFDPDNGLEIPSVKRHRADGPKYVWYDELEPFFARGKSLIVYQHADRDRSGVEGVTKRRVRD